MRKVLIASRGEIAVRIARARRALGESEVSGTATNLAFYRKLVTDEGSRRLIRAGRSRSIPAGSTRAGLTRAGPMRAGPMRAGAGPGHPPRHRRRRLARLRPGRPRGRS